MTQQFYDWWINKLEDQKTWTGRAALSVKGELLHHLRNDKNLTHIEKWRVKRALDSKAGLLHAIQHMPDKPTQVFPDQSGPPPTAAPTSPAPTSRVKQEWFMQELRDAMSPRRSSQIDAVRTRPDASTECFVCGGRGIGDGGRTCSKCRGKGYIVSKR